MRTPLALPLCALFVGASAAAQPSFLVSVDSPRPASLKAALGAEGFAVDCDAKVGEASLELIVSQSEFDRLNQLGLDPAILRRARPFAEVQAERAALAGHPEVPTGYPDLSEVLDSMNTTAAAFPQIAKVIDLQSEFGAPLTHEGRRIHAMKISDNVNQTEDEPTFLLVSAHHVREIVTTVLALGAIERLTTGYGSDPAITQVVNDNEIYIIPVHNPDGYEYVFNVNDFWRKNRRDNGNGTFGVDLNRNYPQGWFSSCSGSTNTSSDTYKGPAPASEPETQALMMMSQQLRFAKVLDYHSFGRETLHGYACSSHPFASFWQGEAVVQSQAHGYNGDIRPPSAEGEHYQWQFANFGSLSFLTETHSEFQPPFTSAEAEEALTWPGILRLLQRPVSVIGTVTDSSTGDPIEADVSIVGLNLQNGETNSSGGPLGRYQHTLPQGPHTLEFSAPGYQTQMRIVDVVSSFSQRIDIELVVEALAISLVQAPPALVAPGEATPIEVEILPGAQQLVPGSAKVFYRDTGGAFTEIPLVPSGGALYSATLPGPSCGTNPEFYIEAMGDGGATMNLPAGAPGQTFTYGVGVLETRFADNFQTNTGWTAENLGATSGDWERGVPVNDPGWEYDPISDSDGSGACLLTQNEPGNTDVDNGAVRITSPEFDLSGDVDIAYDYFLRLTNTNGADALLVEVSTGGAWTQVARHTTDGGLDWRAHTITSAQLAAAGVTGTPTSRIRFTANDDNPQSIVEGGVDAFAVSGLSCESCYADCTGEGTLDIFDFLCFQDAFTAMDPYANCDGNAVLDVFDFLCFQDAFTTGCP